MTKIESTLLSSLHKTASVTAIRYYILIHWLISCRFLQASQLRDGSGILRSDRCRQLEPAHEIISSHLYAAGVAFGYPVQMG